MRTISYRLEDLKKVTIHIGYVAENEHTRVQIDAGDVFEEYPEAVATMKVQPPRGSVYPATVSQDGNIVTWDVKDSDLVSRGAGEIQLTFTQGTVVVKSCIARINIDRSIVGSGTAPNPVQDWIDDANEKLEAVETAIQEAEDAADEIDNMTVAASGSAYGTEPTATITEVEGHKHVAFTIPAGEPGTPGDPTQLIDDTAGQGTTGKTWSADKLNDQFGGVLNDIGEQSELLDDAVYWEENQDDDTIEGIIESEIKDNMTFGLSGTTLSIKYKGDTVCSVQLPTAQPIPCTGVALDLSVATVETEKTVTLTATLTPNNTTDSVTWGSSNDAIASVTNGVVTGVAKGTATITVTCGSFSDTCTVTVTAYFRDLVLGYVLPQSNRLDYRSSYGYKSGGTFNDPFLKKIASGQKVSLKYTPNIISGLYVYMYVYSSGTFTDKCSKVGDDYVLTQAMLDMQSNDTYGILVSSERLSSYGAYASQWAGDYTASQDCFVAFFYNINGSADISNNLDTIKQAIRIEVE